MTIVKLKKVTVLASSKNKVSIVAALQRYGELHIIRPGVQQVTEQRPPNQLETLVDCCQFLEKSEKKIHQNFYRDDEKIDDIVADIKNLKDTISDTQVKLDHVCDDIEKLKPWGDFDVRPLESEFDQKIWFYAIPLKGQKKLEDLTLPWKLIGRDSTTIFFVVVSRSKPNFAQPLELPKESLSVLKRRKNEFLLALDELNVKRIYHTKHLKLIKRLIIDCENKQQRSNTIETIIEHDGFFQLQGWIPVSFVDSLKTLSKEMKFSIVLESPTEKEQPPTLLKPNSLFASGSLLAKIYQLPSYHSWDPSVHLYLSFSLFFAMILSDFGYAMLCAVVWVLCWRKMHNKSPLKELTPLLLSMIASAGVWGLLVNSVFGYPLLSTEINGVPVVDLNNHQSMMSLVLGVGVIHIIVANITRLSVLRHSGLQWLSSVGWVLISSGCYGLWLVKSEFLQNCLFVVTGLGFLGVFLFSYDSTRIKNQPDKMKHIVQSGFLALCNVTKLFSDVLSYMRLFALGLASSSLAITFNNLSVNALDYGGIGVLGGCLIWVAGHSVNVILGIMGGVVHGLRLNFIEFYHWSEPGEGYPFIPFKIKEA